jgi:hypothetical protein
MVFQIRKFDPEKHHRQSCRIKDYDYSQPGSYFITMKSYYNAKIFGKVSEKLMVLNDFGKIVYDEWVKTQLIRTNVRLGEFIIMPDHFHGILIIPKCRFGHLMENESIREIIHDPSHKIGTTNQLGNKNHDGNMDHIINTEYINNGGYIGMPDHRGTLQRAPINVNHDRLNPNYYRFITCDSNMIYDGQQLYSFFHEPIISDFKCHIHGKSEQFGKPTVNTIPSIIRGFKSTVTRQINEIKGQYGKPMCQRSYYLHIIETESEFYMTSNYIRINPQKSYF